MTDTLDTKPTRAELEAEITRLRAADTHTTTRDLAPRKPLDHLRSLKKPRTVEFAGETYTFDVRAVKDTRTMFALRDNDIRTVLERILGEEALNRAVNSIEDEDGYSDFEDLGKLIELIYAEVTAKNS